MNTNELLRTQRYFDSHTHLNNSQLYLIRQELMQQFADHGGVWLVNIGVDGWYNTLGIEIAQQSKSLFPQLQIGCTVGILPCKVTDDNMSNADIDQMVTKIEQDIQSHHNMIWWIGECGTDLHRPCTPKQHEMQQYATYCQAKLAQKYKLPLIIHSRSDRAWTYDVLKDFQDITINLHCWNYTPAEIQIALDTWWDHVYFGFWWILTYPKAWEVRDSLAITPLSQIVLETDAPYLPPQSHRWWENYPHYIIDAYQKASEVLALDLDILCQQVEENWKRLYLRN